MGKSPEGRSHELVAKKRPQTISRRPQAKPTMQVHPGFLSASSRVVQMGALGVAVASQVPPRGSERGQELLPLPLGRPCCCRSRLCEMQSSTTTEQLAIPGFQRACPHARHVTIRAQTHILRTSCPGDLCSSFKCHDPTPFTWA